MLIGWSSPEDVTETTRRHLADLAALRAERDALAAALRRLVQAFDGGYWTACAAAMKNARAALSTPSSPRTDDDLPTCKVCEGDGWRTGCNPCCGTGIEQPPATGGRHE
jgi:hypothetical protein